MRRKRRLTGGEEPHLLEKRLLQFAINVSFTDTRFDFVAAQHSSGIRDQGAKTMNRSGFMTVLASLLLAGPCWAESITFANRPTGPEWNGLSLGVIELRYTAASHEVEVTTTIDGHPYRWVTRNGRYAPQLAGSDCPPVRQIVRLTRARLIYGYFDPQTGRGHMTSIARACLEAGKRCHAHWTVL